MHGAAWGVAALCADVGWRRRRPAVPAAGRCPPGGPPETPQDQCFAGVPPPLPLQDPHGIRRPACPKAGSQGPGPVWVLLSWPWAQLAVGSGLAVHLHAVGWPGDASCWGLGLRPLPVLRGLQQTLLAGCAWEPGSLEFFHVPQPRHWPRTGRRGDKGRAALSAGMAGHGEAMVRSPCFSFRFCSGETEVQEGWGLLRVTEKPDSPEPQAVVPNALHRGFREGGRMVPFQSRDTEARWGRAASRSPDGPRWTQHPVLSSVPCPSPLGTPEMCGNRAVRPHSLHISGERRAQSR